MVGRRCRAVLRRRNSHGVAAVEFALIVPLLIALLVGSVNAGLIFFNYVAMNDSVRAGARFGATAVGTTSSSTSWPAEAVRQRTVDYSATSLQLAQVCVQLIGAGGAVLAAAPASCPAAVGAAPPTPSSSVGATTECFVKVWSGQPATIAAPPLYISPPFALQRGSVTRYERPCL